MQVRQLFRSGRLDRDVTAVADMTRPLRGKFEIRSTKSETMLRASDFPRSGPRVI
jgi:hypothetical protein